jgi:hypothetical protein
MFFKSKNTPDPLLNAFTKFSIELTEKDVVEVENGVASFELDLPDDADEYLLGRYSFKLIQKHSMYEISFSCFFVEIDDDNLDEVKDWIFEANQKSKLGCFKLDENLEFLVYSYNHYVSEFDNIPSQLLPNMFFVVSQMGRVHINNFIKTFT